MCWLSGEPTLDEMLFDPTVITMMKRDGVVPDDVRVLLQEMSRRLNRHSLRGDDYGDRMTTTTMAGVMAR